MSQTETNSGFLNELFSFRIHKRTQGKLVRQITLYAIIAVVAGLGGAWVTAVHLRPRLKARRQAKREARNTPTPDAAAVAAAD